MLDAIKEHTILIVDDERMNIEILSGILSPSYNLKISRNGARAVVLARENNPDLILLDIMMPGMSGFEVIGKLKESGDLCKIPVIFITGLDSAEDEEKGLQLGAVDYITKPFNKAIVKARVNTHIKIVEQMRTIEKCGLIDPLTMISNRRGFENRLGVEWARALREKTPIGIMIMDLDCFKEYNDTYGHQQGDEALKSFARTASGALLRSIDFAARWGGEEFIVLLPGSDAGGAAGVAERIRKETEASTIFTEAGEETKITVSIGVNAAVPCMGSCAEEFVRKADQALYKAKQQGRNRIAQADCD